MDWATQRVVIVGGSSGIGLEIARQCAERGAEAHIASRSTQRLAAAYEELGSDRIHTHSLDFAHESSVRRTFETIGRFHHLAITAAQGLGGLFLDLEAGQMREVFEGKFMGQCITARAAVPHLESTGSIIFFSSLASHRAMSGLSAIAAMNGAIESLMRTLALELRPIRVNAVVPGVIDTPAHAWMGDDKRREWFAELAKLLPAGRVGNPADAAHGALFLMENSFTTGTLLHIDGGHSVV